MSERPRRSTRAPARTIEVKEPTSPSRAKRKAPDVDHAEQLRFMLENPKSALTTMDISVRQLPGPPLSWHPIEYICHATKTTQWTSY